MRLTFLGATETVTGSKYLLEISGKRILVDCGLFQGLKELRLRNWAKLPVDPKTINAVILTHAHIDHSGYIPLLVKNGFAGPIYCSKATKELCEILLPDSGYLQEEEARFANKYGYSKHKPALPLYTMGDAHYALEYFKTIKQETEYKLTNNITFRLLDAGHIFGASSLIVRTNNKSITFSGDIGRFNDPIMHAPHSPKSTNYLVIESTYGNHLHDTTDPAEILCNIIKETVRKKGVVIIPAFAVGRTQLILYYLYRLKQKQLIPDIPIYVDSPMATDVSMLFCDFFTEHRLSKKETYRICSIAKYVKTREESKLLDEKASSKIIISASGMATGGRVLHHLKRFLPNKNNTVVFTGYQAEGTRGERLLHGAEEIKIHGEYFPVNAKITVLNNLSAHADYSEILLWLRQIKSPPKTTFITHGSLKSSETMQQRLTQQLNWRCIVPKYMQSFNL